MINTATLTIDLAALRENLATAKRLAPNSRVVAMVKANAYGHGLIEAAGALQQADALGVARLEEALDLRKAGIEQRILLLGSLLDSDDLKLCSEHRIDLAIHDLATAGRLLSMQLKSSINIWLKLDIGMHRLGLEAGDFRTLAKQLSAHPGTGELVAMSHFSESENPDRGATEHQQAQLLALGADLNLPMSLANSAAIVQHPQSHQQWIRPGIMLYGSNPIARHPLSLKPVMSLHTRVLALRKIAAGEGVGYNHRWRATRPSLLATIGIGYGDGYPRHAVDGTPVIVKGQRAVIAGRVSMDLSTIDVTDCQNIQVGDAVELWGGQLSVDEVARHAATISYQLFTGVTQRVTRRYINS